MQPERLQNQGILHLFVLVLTFRFSKLRILCSTAVIIWRTGNVLSLEETPVSIVSITGTIAAADGILEI